jgi:hypothetical protein
MATESLTAQVTEQVAENLEETAKAVRAFGISNVTFLGAGLVVGISVGFFLGYRFNREKIRAEEFENSKREIEQIREAYRERNEIAPEKPSLEDVVEKKGYVVVEGEEPPRPTRPPVVVQPPLSEKQQNEVENLVQRIETNAFEWDYETEVLKRSKNHPYVIHQDEYNENADEHNQLVWTYYAGDNILADEHDEIVTRPELVVGEPNLKRFGHGSDDTDVVFVRNERLEIDFEICRSWKSFAHEVQGLDENDETVPETET